jgi:hypothetical protein
MDAIVDTRFVTRFNRVQPRIERMPFVAILEPYAYGILAQIHLKIHLVNSAEREAEILTVRVLGIIHLGKGEMSFRSRVASAAPKNFKLQAAPDPTVPFQPVLYIVVLDKI